ncbi:MAG: hypothetical protein AAF488_01940 [Planctomycetota bacterium]
MQQPRWWVKPSVVLVGVLGSYALAYGLAVSGGTQYDLGLTIADTSDDIPIYVSYRFPGEGTTGAFQIGSLGARSIQYEPSWRTHLFTPAHWVDVHLLRREFWERGRSQ